MRIAICDDDINLINILEEYIERLDNDHGKMVVDTFTDGESLYDYYLKNKNPFNIIFLDMELPGMNGIETAVNIRKGDSGVIIIFITSHSQYVYECFDAAPFRFLVKPVSFEDFSKTLNLAILKAKQEDTFLLISTKGSDLRLNYNDILYFESIKRQTAAHTGDGEYLFYSKISDLFEKLRSEDFIFVHKSFIVNMNYIKMILPDKIVLQNGEDIPLSKKYKKQVREKHLEFIERSYNL